MKAFADNCGACGGEVLSTELTPVKLGGISSEIRICVSCLTYANIIEEYKSAAELISMAFEASDAELQSPNVVVEPANSIIQKAVNLIKQIEPGYFVGVRKIVVSASPDYGHVESGPDKDPAVINVNLARVQNEAGGDEKSAVRSIAGVIAHERGHVKSFNSSLGFQGGEGPAEAEEKRVLQLIDNLPEYK
ncbi:MAG TPA: hypothetical protein VM577_19305 [Anaerovoracaceae bacterium]|nr:hypothetical protein [Anaerovoracaceae bacterium]